MSLAKQYYDLNGLKGKIFYNIHEFIYIIEHNIFKMRKLRPAFLDAIRTHSLNKNMIGVEIGVNEGKNAFSMLKHLSIKKLYLIDPYVKYSNNDRYITGNQKSFNNAKKNLKRYSDKIEFIQDFAENAIDVIPNNLDFVYIDGNHDYDFVKKDVELYFKKLKLGGLIGFDDTGLYSVSKVIIESVDELNLISVDKRINCLRKVK